jgi:predicted TIM-barrel fold metal-dependent hydrolase
VHPDSVVDSHVHLLPGRLAVKVRAFFAPLAPSMPYPLDHDAVRVQLASEGIGEVWTLPYAHKPGVAHGLNVAAVETSRQPGPLAVVPGATVHPGDDDPRRIVRDAVEELGCRVLKLHCSVGDFEADDPRLDTVWRYISVTRLPVVVHVGHGTDGRTEAHELAPLERVARAHPDAVIIVAHCGHPAVDATLDLLERHVGVHADLTPVMTDPPAIPPDRLAGVAPKLLFGSDAPNTTMRAGDHLRAVRALPLDPAAIGAITGGTARRLLGRVELG